MKEILFTDIVGNFSSVAAFKEFKLKRATTITARRMEQIKRIMANCDLPENKPAAMSHPLPTTKENGLWKLYEKAP